MGILVRCLCDNLNTYTKRAFYEAFDPEQARAYLKRIKFCYTPKHASWLNVTECEISCRATQCLSDRRAGEVTELPKKITIWSEKNQRQAKGRRLAVPYWKCPRETETTRSQNQDLKGRLSE